MKDLPRFGPADLLCLLLVVGCAAGVRVWYVARCADLGHADPVLRVQDPGGAFPDVVRNLSEQRRFNSRAPLADRDEPTAHVAPGYPWLYAQFARVTDDPAAALRWLQCLLATLTVLGYFLFARLVFFSTPAAALTGLLAALHPFWVINTAELADGTLASFLLAASLLLGTQASREGGAVTSLLFGLSLAALALVRAALLPFTLVAIVWFLYRCRAARWGWFAGLLAFLGYANGLAPWAVRNWNAFGEPLPVVSSAYLHLWEGNNPLATGADLDEEKLRASLPPDVRDELLQEPNQARRYARLGPLVLEEIAEHPDAALARRLDAGLMFLFGEAWFRDRTLAVRQPGDDVAEVPDWLADNADLLLRGSLLFVLLFALLGWRWSLPWYRSSRLATFALLLVPLPYVLSHASYLSGPRLPLDGVLLCYAGYALATLVPKQARPAEQAEVIVK